MNQTEIKTSLNRLIQYIEKENYSGFDPYDALKSPVFSLPFFRSNKYLRFGIQQLVKRSPFNLRPLLQIKKGLNPVTLGLCIQGYTNLGIAGEMDKKLVIEKCSLLLLKLKELQAKNYNGVCWGYDFPWEARHAQIPPYAPTVVATGIITNALMQYHFYSGDSEVPVLCRSACEFVLKDLHHSQGPGNSICFSYSPFDEQQVFNASMKAVRLLSQVYYLTKEPHLKEMAGKAAQFVVNHQQPDGSWYYSPSPKGRWIDNYHTGYILDCLDDYQKFCDDATWEDQIKKGLSYYINNLFHNGYIPKFYNSSVYPLDCTAASQAILTLTRFGNQDMAKRTAAYTIAAMQDRDGFFYFRKYRFYTEKHSFMRWSNAWMMAALSDLLK